jgi:hypothetical protein
MKIVTAPFRALWIWLKIRWATADIRGAQNQLRHAQDDLERLPEQIRFWEKYVGALRVQLIDARNFK